MPLWVTASVLVHELLFLGWIQYQTRMPREDAPLAIEFIDLDTVTATPTEPESDRIATQSNAGGAQTETEKPVSTRRDRGVPEPTHVIAGGFTAHGLTDGNNTGGKNTDGYTTQSPTPDYPTPAPPRPRPAPQNPTNTPSAIQPAPRSTATSPSPRAIPSPPTRIPLPPPPLVPSPPAATPPPAWNRSTLAHTSSQDLGTGSLSLEDWQRQQRDNNDRTGSGSGVSARADVDWGPYTSALQRQVEQRWWPTSDSSSEVEVEFEIQRSGHINPDSLRVVRSSGSDTINRAALAAITESSPFGSFPPNYTQDSILVTFTFTVQ